MRNAHWLRNVSRNIRQLQKLFNFRLILYQRTSFEICSYFACYRTIETIVCMAPSADNLISSNFLICIINYCNMHIILNSELLI